MTSYCKSLTVVVVALLIARGWATSSEEEEDNPAKMAKSVFPKKFQPMDLSLFRTEAPSTTETNEETKDEPAKDELEKKTLDELTNSEEEQFEQKRPKKSTVTKFCVEINPSSPYQKPFEVCQKASYSNKLPYTTPRPNYPPNGPYNSHPSDSVTYGRPIVLLPHVPVAEPYHVPSGHYKPSAPTPVYHGQPGNGYRSSSGGWNPNEMSFNNEDEPSEMEGRTAYYNDYDSYGKVPIYDYHKKKEISYIPFVTDSYAKSKPLKFLKTIKDLKKDKYKLDYDDDYHNSYYSPPNYGHDQYYGGYGNHIKTNAHGLVITCQPSAVGYSGNQYDSSPIDLGRHLDVLKNIYSQTYKLNQPSGYGDSSAGYVAPHAYRNSEWNARQAIQEDGAVDPTLKSPAAGAGTTWSAKQAIPDRVGSNLLASAGPNPTMEAMMTQELKNNFRNAQQSFAIQPNQQPQQQQ